MSGPAWSRSDTRTVFAGDGLHSQSTDGLAVDVNGEPLIRSFLKWDDCRDWVTMAGDFDGVIIREEFGEIRDSFGDFTGFGRTYSRLIGF